MKSLTKASRLTLKEGDQILFKKGDTFKGHLNLLNLQGKSNNPITIVNNFEGTSFFVGEEFVDEVNLL